MPMTNLHSYTGEPETAPAWPAVSYNPAHPVLRPITMARAAEVTPYGCIEQVPVTPLGAYAYGLDANVLTALALVRRAGLAPIGFWQQHPNAQPPASFVNTGAIYGSLFPGAVIGVCNSTAATTGSYTLATIIDRNAKTYNWDGNLRVAPASDPFVGYERYDLANWDGYGADPITTETLSAARVFLQMLPRTLGDPDIAPGADGAIGLEWAFNNRPLRKLFIDIGPGHVWSGFWRRATGEKGILPTVAIDPDTKHYLAKLFNELNS